MSDIGLYDQGMETIGDRVRQRREKLGLTQSELARQIGVSPQSIQQLESGEVKQPKYIFDLQVALKTDAGWLQYGKTEVLPKKYSLRKPTSQIVEIEGDEFVSIPVFDVRAAAGSGALDEVEAVVAQAIYPRPWLRALTPTSIGRLAVIKVDGDSMWETLHHGDQVLVDRTYLHFIKDGIYLLEMGEGLQIKRCAIHPTSRMLTVKSDNPAYPVWDDINPDDVRFAGRVIWLGRQL